MKINKFAFQVIVYFEVSCVLKPTFMINSLSQILRWETLALL
ncbi:hypothetical protein N748_09405 [Legionella pneumophila str. 121004]|nr:hypothetical protein N748_09405 [Legionella pneumophila str. 121004]ERH42869.1 hypothetical protein N750_02360 [Legionella pneumophila str. Leg01/53]ERH43892.1 hypothetical protein N751_14955 [Legionella pneumophila str. Leg01/11]ERI47301.1 hypothetical protein N749_14830 [Legionella pneumophila str. Leg01/20]